MCTEKLFLFLKRFLQMGQANTMFDCRWLSKTCRLMLPLSLTKLLQMRQRNPPEDSTTWAAIRLATDSVEENGRRQQDNAGNCN